MTDDRFGRRLVLAGGLGCAAVMACGRAIAQPVVAGIVERTRGEVRAEHDGETRVLGQRAPLRVGDLIATGGGARVTLQLDPSTALKLGGVTRLRLTRLLPGSDAELDFLAGHLLFERKGRAAGGSVLIRTAYGRMVAGAGRFYAGPSRGEFAVLVGDGTLEMNAAGRVVLIRAQEAVELKGPGHPPTVPAPWTVVRVREMQAYFV